MTEVRGGVPVWGRCRASIGEAVEDGRSRRLGQPMVCVQAQFGGEDGACQG